jgi:hypothetical protein
VLDNGNINDIISKIKIMALDFNVEDNVAGFLGLTQTGLLALFPESGWIGHH